MNTGKRGIIGYAGNPTQGASRVKKLRVEWKINTLKRAGVGIETIKEREISTQPLFVNRISNSAGRPTRYRRRARYLPVQPSAAVKTKKRLA
jgi:hypothetical protein